MIFPNRNYEREQEVREEYKQDWVGEQIAQARQEDERMKEEMRQYVDRVIEAKGTPDFEEFCDEQHIHTDIPAREELILSGWFWQAVEARQALGA